MKRLIKKTLLFLIPFVLLFAFFFTFETYDYFAFGTTFYQKFPLSPMRYTKLRQPENIILGDSRMANLDTDYIREISGVDYAKLAFGGAEIGESIDMFWYAAEHCELKRVIFGINFYTFRGGQVGENKSMRVEKAKAEVDSVFKFATNMNYWLEAMANAKQKITNPIFKAIGREDLVSIPEDPVHLPIIPDPTMGEKWRANMEKYADDIYKAMRGPGFRQEIYDDLQDIAEYCKANGIEMKEYAEIYLATGGDAFRTETYDALIEVAAYCETNGIEMNENASKTYDVMNGVDFRQETYDALGEIAEYCDANGIELVFVFPPVHDVIYERVIWPRHMEDELQYMKDYLIERATVYDFEIRSDFSAEPDSFYDGFHLMLENKHLFARQIFSDTNERPDMVQRYIRNGVAVIPEHLETAFQVS